MHVQYHHPLHGTGSSFHDLFSCTKIRIIFFCWNEKIACVYLFSQRPFKTQCSYLQTHNDQSDTLKERAPGRRCSPGTGQHGLSTIGSFFWIENDWEINVFFCSNSLFKRELQDVPAYFKEQIMKMIFINTCTMNHKLSHDYNVSIQPLIWLSADRNYVKLHSNI